jgi:gamma-glutamylcyclotransferase (GGCT)/AIG2-like uncharacterized protein YtfP
MRKTNKRSPGYKTKAELKKERRELTKQSKMEKKHLVGIYDHFRKDGILNSLLPEPTCKLIGTFSTEPIYNMYYVENDNNCVIQENGNSSIKIEVWEVNESSLIKIEKEYCYYAEFEDYPQEYTKKTLVSPFGNITLYISITEQDSKELIIDGDWIEHINSLKV